MKDQEGLLFRKIIKEKQSERWQLRQRGNEGLNPLTLKDDTSVHLIISAGYSTQRRLSDEGITSSFSEL